MKANTRDALLIVRLLWRGGGAQVGIEIFERSLLFLLVLSFASFEIFLVVALGELPAGDLFCRSRVGLIVCLVCN
jgi:hypothetical protein